MAATERVISRKATMVIEQIPDLLPPPSDFGDNFIAGVRENLPNAENVFDPFHLINLANRKLDADRAANQVNGERLKSIRYALLKDPENLKPEEREALFDITRDNEVIATSYAMKESLRQVYSLPLELARDHLVRWVEWVMDCGSRAFKALAKTVKAQLEGILRAIETGINNAYHESLNGRMCSQKGLRTDIIEEIVSREWCTSETHVSSVIVDELDQSVCVSSTHCIIAPNLTL